MRRLVKIASVAVLLAGCTALPAFGPSDFDVIEGAQSASPEREALLPYDLINISPNNIGQHGARSGRSFYGPIASSRLSNGAQRLSTGDVLQVIVREPGDDGLFATAGKRAEEITAVVDHAGNVSLPYVDEISVRGRSIADVRDELSLLYGRQAINPEVQIRVAQTDANSVSILGDVGAAGRVPIPLRGIRLLDLIAQAGGVAAPAWEVHVTILRRGQSQTVRYDDVLASSRNNVPLRPDDIVQIEHRPRKLSIFGAVKTSGRFGVDEPVATVVNLLGAAGGLDGGQAEPRSIFVYRPAGHQKNRRATVYRFDLRRADAFFLGTEFAVQDGDVIYVATADTFDLQKLLTFVVSPLNQLTN